MRRLSTFLVAIMLSTQSSAQDASPIADGAKLEKLAGGFKFTEGPAPDAEGNVYFTDQPNDRILKWSTDGKLTTFMEPCGRSNGLCFDKDGNLWACADEKNELWRIDVKTKEKTVVVKDYDGQAAQRPQRRLGAAATAAHLLHRPVLQAAVLEARAEGAGRAGASTSSRPDGKLLTPRAMATSSSPTASSARPTARRSTSPTSAASKTYAYDIETDGSLKNRKLFCEQGSDGMTIDDGGQRLLHAARA